MSIQSNVNQTISLAGFVITQSEWGKKQYSARQIQKKINQVDSEFRSYSEEANKATEKLAEHSGEATEAYYAPKAKEALEKELPIVEKRAELVEELYQNDPSRKNYESMKKAKEGAIQARYSVEAQIEGMREKPYTAEEIKIAKEEIAAERNRKAFAAKEAKRIRQAATSDSRYWPEYYDSTKTYKTPNREIKL